MVSLDTLVERLQQRDWTIRDEANAIVAYAFRNGPLEDLHAGRHSELLDDPTLSRVTDDEMKALMIDACERMEELLELRERSPVMYQYKVRTYGALYCGRWDRGAEVARVAIGKQLKLIREQGCGLSLERAAELMKYTTRYLARLEAGDFPHLSRAFMERMAKTYFSRSYWDMRTAVERGSPPKPWRHDRDRSCDDAANSIDLAKILAWEESGEAALAAAKPKR